ncbi:uncharacterized protein LOC130674571 [Microplitis mediator]|uniref:uncharacterized protein LOC130674571 n=1 Tax=Microplitis mediator TaxID=375433 RepID=UPI002552B04B|nr:uncharacterized protein LOC130674571 [Microplitis mediator]
MRWKAKIILCFLFVSATEIYDIKIPIPSAQGSLPITHNYTLQLLELCFSDRLNPVVIDSNFIDIVHGITSNNEQNVSVILIDQNYSDITDEDQKIEFVVYPCYPTFIFSAETVSRETSFLLNLRSHLEKINYWSAESSFFLIIGNKCGDALQNLMTLMVYKAIKTYYICLNDIDNSTSIYTLNPYADRAPKPWQKVEGPKEPYSGSTLFNMSFINDTNICSSITFDKTKFLDGHKLYVEDDLTGQKSNFHQKNLNFYEDLLSEMNVTQVNSSFFRKNGDSMYISNSYELIDNMMEVSNILPYFAQEGFIIVTQKQSFIPTFEQVIDSFFSRDRIVMSCVILTFFFLMMLLNHKYDFNAAVLDLLSFLLDMGISTPMLTVSMRITFMTAALFALIFNPVFQGQLTSFLSRPGHGNVETLQDLRDNNYHVYFTSMSVSDELYDRKIWDKNSYTKYLHRLFFNSHKVCVDKVKKNSSIACVLDATEFEHVDPNTHISNIFSYKYRVFVTEKGHPLNRKINKIALKLFETGHLSHAERRDLHRILLARKRKLDKIKALRKYNQLELEDFRLAYIAVVLAFAWAILVFGIEVTFRKLEARLDKRSKEREMRKLIIRRRIVSTANRINNLTQ